MTILSAVYVRILKNMSDADFRIFTRGYSEER